ncbi:MAG: hypothetical protein ACRDAI_03880 [Candidatus Rhabdochlamydia sp.]
MNFQILENIYRVCNVVTNISDSYQIYYNENLSPWEKVCRITPRLFGFAADSALLASPSCSSIKSADLNKLRAVSVTSNATGFISDITFSKEPISYKNAANMAINVAQVIDQTGIVSISGKALFLAAETFSLAISLHEIVSKRESIKKVALTFIKNLNLPNHEQSLEQAIIDLVEHMKTTKEENWKTCIQNVIEDCKKILDNEPVSTFGRIPYPFLNRKEFQKRKCMITNRLILEAVVIKETITSSRIYYEYNNLSSWYNRKRGILPPEWPKTLPFNRDTITIDHSETAQITEALQAALESTQNDPIKQENIRITLTAIPVLLESIKQISTNEQGSIHDPHESL